ncbi:hypothetical protein A9G41_10350 [Gilliamella sp. Nev5-1]|jgi:uncharacterized protein|nr:hypothetical protein A9G40_08385 [Gilliamella apicola]OCG67466.1 hypothetical protein A9G41_10350 [Gilliamella apicola]
MNAAPFPCYQCGTCCCNVNRAQETQHLDNGNGTCFYYDHQTKLCTIYEDRPEICRVDKQYQLNYKDKYSWVEFVEMNMIACKVLNSKG